VLYSVDSWSVFIWLLPSHPVYAAVPAPASECLPLEVEEDAKKAPQQDQARIRHDRRDETIFFRPVGNEFAESISPHIFVDLQ
jgi:hypothetical protein